MDGENDGKGAQAQVVGEQAPQGDQAAQARQAASDDIGGGKAAASDGAASAGADYGALLAERDARIAELEGQIAEAAKTAESAERLRAEMDELRRQGEEQRVAFELQIAGARNVKAATALLQDPGGDVEKLKAAAPGLFGVAAAPAPAGATGLPNAGAATDGSATLKRWRKIAGLDNEGKE